MFQNSRRRQAVLASYIAMIEDIQIEVIANKI